MSDYDDDDTLVQDDDDTPPEPKKNDWRRKLEADAEAGRKATVEAQSAKRELAFLRAGVDLDTPHGKLFAKAYDGDPTVDAVKAAAVEFGVIEAQANVPADELAGHDRIASAASGADQPSDEQGYLAELQAAQNPADVLAVLAKAGIPVDNSKPGSWMRSESMGSLPLQ